MQFAQLDKMRGAVEGGGGLGGLSGGCSTPPPAISTYGWYICARSSVLEFFAILCFLSRSVLVFAQFACLLSFFPALQPSSS